MDLYEKVLRSDTKFSGKVLTVRVDEIVLPNGAKSSREVIEHNGAVGVVPITADGSVLLVRQYRAASKKVMLEIPAGKLEKGENPYECGLRELEEETGFCAEKLEKLTTYYSSPAILEEVLHLYLAVGLQPGTVHLDDDEFLECIAMPFETVRQKILDGEITDAKTIIGILLAAAHLKQ